MRRWLKRGLRALLLAWAAAALLSLLVRAIRGPAADAPLPAGASAATLTRDDGTRLRLAYRTWGERAHPAVLLIHGSPGRGEHFARLAPLLAERFFLVAPDLPGFGDSSAELPDLSIAAHGADLRLLLDALELPRAHLVGYSLGSGPALHLWERAPERVASLTLLSAVGVQEMELLGDYALNHGLHLLQLSLVRALDLLVPHFGATDVFRRARNYARNFTESDQRPLRALLERYDGPALVIHGEDDFLVPIEAAREHLRLLPQAREWIAPSAPGLGEADHFMVFRGDPPFAPALREFLLDVEAGRAPGRADAAPERLAAASRPYDPASAPPARGPFLALLLLLIALATFASEDLACVGAGILAASGRIAFPEAAGAAFAGILAGDLGLFLAGRWLGRPALRRAPLRWFVSPAAFERGAEWFAERGSTAILVSRFAPGMRLPTYLAAGLLGTGLLPFLGWFTLAALLWTPALVGLAMLVGQRALAATDWIGAHPLVTLGAALAAVLVVTRLLPALLTHAGRRRLVGRWLRLRHWEFWPAWAVYPPVVLWVAWLAWRHRSLAVVTAVNPGIPGGGFVGESKWQILRRLAGAGDAVPPTELLPAGMDLDERLLRLDAFMARHALSFPVVLKPDAGQRGSGVKVCRRRAEAQAWLERSPVDMLAQAHVTGEEFGVFWYRAPGAPRGHIFSITEKRLPEVTGDGARSVEQLIADDPRAVAMAAAYATALGPRLHDVPARGERVRLTDLGTHCRGAVFLDARHLATDALRAEIDRIAAAFDGFAFGRFDLRAPSSAHLQRGEGLRVIELNGLTSEATHIYDRRHSILHAWFVLCHQWALAFQIGAAQRTAGAPITPLRELLGMIVEYRRTARARGAD